MIREPAVAGQFYPDDPQQLRADLARMITLGSPRERVIGLVAPHAGYLYSGSVAGSAYGAVEVPQAVIILGPNHHGVGAEAAIFPSGAWRTPLGNAEINKPLADLVKRHVPLIKEDDVAHRFEHSLEVQVPFLQFVRTDVSIVPISLGFAGFATCRELGLGLAEAVRDYSEPVLIVASSDMTHYEPADIAKNKDTLAISEMLALSAEGLHKVCRDRHITMCGVIPATVMLVAALELGAGQAKLLHYATSGDVTGDKSQVVAYAALSVY